MGFKLSSPPSYTYKRRKLANPKSKKYCRNSNCKKRKAPGRQKKVRLFPNLKRKKNRKIKEIRRSHNSLLRIKMSTCKVNQINSKNSDQSIVQTKTKIKWTRPKLQNKQNLTKNSLKKLSKDRLNKRKLWKNNNESSMNELMNIINRKIRAF